MKAKILYSKLSWPAICLAMMLQRSPVVRYIAEIEFSLIPRVQNLWTVLVAGVTVGAYNSVTAASGKIEIAPGSTDATVALGEQLSIILWVGGEKANSPFKPEDWEHTGALPVGVVFEEKINEGTYSFSGTPTEAGQFPITVRAWEKLDKNEGSNDEFSFTIIVEGSGLTITQQPANKTLPWGEPLSLSATVDVVDETTYQWQRILSGEIDYSDINGATGNALSLAKVTSADEGMYRLVATNGGTAYPSDPATVTVTTTPFQSWRENNFQDPFSADSTMDQDPDKDTLNNTIEFTFGLDPNKPESVALVKTSLEIIDTISHVVYTFPPLAAEANPQVSAEASSTLESIDWSQLEHGVAGTIISSTPEAYIVKVPITGSSFNRLKIVSN